MIDQVSTTTHLRSEMLEQVMRLTGDELAVLRFVDAAPGSFPAKVALGRLLSEPGIRLVSGCPLFAYLTDAELDPSWRASYPTSASSLWSELEFLAGLLGDAPTLDHERDPYALLCELRDRAAAELPGLDSTAA